MRYLICLFLLFQLMPSTVAAPDLMHYEGALYDLEDGTHDFVVTFYREYRGGRPLAVEHHTRAHGNPVVSWSGRFAFLLGGGVMDDGPAEGRHDRLAAIFSEADWVWLELEIDGRRLPGRVQLLADAFWRAAEHSDPGGRPGA